MPTNPSTGTGWKNGADIPCKKDIVQCIEKNAYLGRVKKMVEIFTLGEGGSNQFHTFLVLENAI